MDGVLDKLAGPQKWKYQGEKRWNTHVNGDWGIARTTQFLPAVLFETGNALESLYWSNSGNIPPSVR